MAFRLPSYRAPDFSKPPFPSSPLVQFKRVTKSGTAPEDYHATSIYPEYYQIHKGKWVLLDRSRMDCAVVRQGDENLVVKPFRRLKRGDPVACGRRENGEDGIFVHIDGFGGIQKGSEKFAFRTAFTRETPFSIDYDELYELLAFERVNGCIAWVLGPAVTFDRDARNAFAALIRGGYVHCLLAGNALAVHDLEVSFFGTALGQEIYSKQSVALGHYNHLDAINKIRTIGSIREGIDKGLIGDGIMRAIIENQIPYVLAGSIRDDGPLPEVIGDAYSAQDEMRRLLERATTVITLATQLHTIASGNMVPSYTIGPKQQVRPVYFYSVDMSEFAVGKLSNRGSLTARSILTNVQDFVSIVERGLRKRE